MFSTSMNQFLASNSHLCRWHWYSAKKWSKMLISAWSRSPKILHPPFCSYHRLLCNDKALEKNTAGKSAIRAWDIKIKSTIKVNVRDFERWSEIAGWLRKTVQLVCVSVRPAPIPAQHAHNKDRACLSLLPTSSSNLDAECTSVDPSK